MAALNKYFGKVSYDEYMNEWDLPMIQNAVAIAQFPKEVDDWIWEKDIKPFQLF